MPRRTIPVIALCSTLLAAAALAQAAQAGNVAWGVTVGGPGFVVSAGQPGWGGGRAFVGVPVRPFAPVFWRPWVRPAPIVAPVVAPLATPIVTPVVAPVAVVPAPVVTPWVARPRVVVVRRPPVVAVPRAVMF